MKYEENASLTALMNTIIKRNVKELSQTKRSSIIIQFTDTESEHYGGRCKLVEASVRAKTGFHFSIVIFRPEFDRLNRLGKIRLLVHELHHIDYEGDKPRIRRHSGDYCEIPEHDDFSETIARSILDTIDMPYFEVHQATGGIRIYQNP